ncbi:hypothetical protein CLV58_14116 [Spirosoma oryzae]|uniref:Uncharacterized protein n=1 Tax=Spirosoma oryzae TaxID=1469603 RepID=A0A2T0RQM0_9BACT|nr:hypothetical protein CLV58_14116 [Spirosoma oryzae]
MVQAAFLSTCNGNNPDSRNTSLEQPCRTLTTENRCALVGVKFLTSYYTSGASTSSMNDPAATLATQNRLSLVQGVQLIDAQYGNSKPASVEEPAAT